MPVAVLLETCLVAYIQWLRGTLDIVDNLVDCNWVHISMYVCPVNSTLLLPYYHTGLSIARKC